MKIEKKRIEQSIFISLMVLSILILGASLQGCELGKKQAESFGGGGLVFNFVENAPPSEVVLGIPFNIFIDVENKGGATLTSGSANFYLSGIGEAIQSTEIKKTNSVNLEKASEYFSGGKERIKFSETATSSLPIENVFPLNLELTACYDYSTVTESVICVGKSSGVCSIGGEKITSNSSTSAPVTVTSIKENVVGNKLIITFIISNEGRGKVYSPNSDCELLQQGEINERLNEGEVYVDVVTEQGFTCLLKQKGTYSTIRDTSGQATIGSVTCEKVLSENEETHSAIFKIITSYKYREKKNKVITIIPV